MPTASDARACEGQTRLQSIKLIINNNGRLKETQSFPDSLAHETPQAAHEFLGTGCAEVGHVASGDSILHRCRGLHRILGVALVVLDEVAAKFDENIQNYGAKK